MIATPLLAELGALPDIVWDGFVRDNGAAATAGICVRDKDAILLNVDLSNNGANATTDTQVHRCDQPKLAAVAL